MLVSRPGVEKPFTVIVKPDRSHGGFFIGVGKRVDHATDAQSQDLA